MTSSSTRAVTLSASRRCSLTGGCPRGRVGCSAEWSRKRASLRPHLLWSLGCQASLLAGQGFNLPRGAEMSSIRETAEQFFDACETGKGWEGCQAYCHAGATFSAQAGALDGVDTLEGYT